MKAQHLPKLEPVAEEPPAESRRAGRVPCDQLKCSLGTIEDLSLTGARLTLKRWTRPRPGEQLALHVKNSAGEVLLGAEIVWVKKVGWASYEVGLRFTANTREFEAFRRIALQAWDKRSLSRPRRKRRTPA